MSQRIPNLRNGIELTDLALDATEGFVVSRIDGTTSVSELAFLTGLPEERVGQILERLGELDVLEPPPASPPSAATTTDAGRDGDPGDGDEAEADDTPEEAATSAPGGKTTADGPEARNWRALFERELHPLELDQRIERARTADGDPLRAFCFDPAAKVINAVLDNPKTGLEHARLIAQHHRASSGLDTLGSHTAFRRDRQVRQLLFRNPQTSDRLVHRLIEGRRMGELYQLSIQRDLTERVRRTLRREFRQRFGTGSAEERVALILKCEGRCLPLLTGLALDGKAAALLCRRTLGSTLLLQNLARWPSTPPPVLAHLSRQPIAQRSPMLRNLILRHPNAPSQLRR